MFFESDRSFVAGTKPTVYRYRSELPTLGGSNQPLLKEPTFNLHLVVAQQRTF